MSDDSATTQNNTKARPMNRWNIGTLSVLQIFSLLIIVILANFLGSRYFSRSDLSRGENYSLSNWTIGLLQSTQVQERKTPVKMIVAFRRSTAMTERVRVLAAE